MAANDAGSLRGMDQALNEAPERTMPVHGVTLSEAFRVWFRVALLSFGGPAGQIAVMHKIIVEEKRWVSENRFLHALNYCMLLPGPEAQQLATYIGWLMHRTLGESWRAGCSFCPASSRFFRSASSTPLMEGRIRCGAVLWAQSRRACHRDRGCMPDRQARAQEQGHAGSRRRGVPRHFFPERAVPLDRVRGRSDRLHRRARRSAAVRGWRRARAGEWRAKLAWKTCSEMNSPRTPGRASHAPSGQAASGSCCGSRPSPPSWRHSARETSSARSQSFFQNGHGHVRGRLCRPRLCRPAGGRALPVAQARRDARRGPAWPRPRRGR